MGSNISIHNNTDDIYVVKAGIDEAALAATGSVKKMLQLVMVMIVPLLKQAGVQVDVGRIAEIYELLAGLISGIAAIITNYASRVSGRTFAPDNAGFAEALCVLLDKNYVLIKPGERHTFGKYSLSLWLQGTCHRVKPDPNCNKQVIMDTVYMKPILSGATHNSTREHEIQYWVNKRGHSNCTVIQFSMDFATFDDHAAAQLMDIYRKTTAK